MPPSSALPTSPQSSSRRTWLRTAVAGTTVSVLGGLYVVSEHLTLAHAGEKRPDGRPRVPPGQRVLERLKPMGGRAGSSHARDFKLRVHGEVNRTVELDFRQLLELPQVELTLDVHCVTGWSLLGARWKGVRLTDVAERAGIKDSARHVIIEAAHGYTANVPRGDALKPDVLLTYEHEGRPLAPAHGAPVRALVPDLYFWKSAKWLSGLRFARRDAPGYWETRGYHNHADPWREERYG